MNKAIIGVDIGGSNMRAAVFLRDRVSVFKKFKTPKTKKEFIARLRKMLSLPKSGDRALGVGISIAGVVGKGKIIKSPNIPYLKNFDFRLAIPKKMPLVVENDARAFARAELWARKNKGSILALTLGTGVGRAYGEDGKIKKIKRFEYPERWEKEYQAIWDKEALAIYLSKKLHPIFARYPSDVVVLGGGVSSHPKFFKKFKRLLRKQGVKALIEKSKLPKYAGAWGAALLVI